MTSATLCGGGGRENDVKKRDGAYLPSGDRAEIPDEKPRHGLVAHATKDDPAFSYIKSRLGVVREKTCQLGSPFDYSQQATLYIETDLPEPNDTLRFLPVAWEGVVKYL